MDQQKRYRTPYSKLPDPEKKAMDDRRKILATEKKGKKPQLFPVPVHELPRTASPASADIQGPAKIGTSANFSQDLDEDLCMTFTTFLVFIIAKFLLTYILILLFILYRYSLRRQYW